MAVRILVRMQAKAGTGDRMAEIMAGMLPDTMSREGAIELELLRDLDDRDLFYATERWRERADHEAYVEWRASSGTGAELATVLEAVEMRYLETIGEW